MRDVCCCDVVEGRAGFIWFVNGSDHHQPLTTAPASGSLARSPRTALVASNQARKPTLKPCQDAPQLHPCFLRMRAGCESQHIIAAKLHRLHCAVALGSDVINYCLKHLLVFFFPCKSKKDITLLAITICLCLCYSNTKN